VGFGFCVSGKGSEYRVLVFRVCGSVGLGRHVHTLLAVEAVDATPSTLNPLPLSTPTWQSRAVRSAWFGVGGGRKIQGSGFRI
jgi:hypothetical protein